MRRTPRARSSASNVPAIWRGACQQARGPGGLRGLQPARRRVPGRHRPDRHPRHGGILSHDGEDERCAGRLTSTVTIWQGQHGRAALVSRGGARKLKDPTVTPDLPAELGSRKGREFTRHIINIRKDV